MRCPECGSSQSDVLDSRTYPNRTRRRRQCRDCGARWTTHEISADVLDTIHQLSSIVHQRGLVQVSVEQRRRKSLRQQARQQAAETGECLEKLYEKWGCA